MLAVITLQILGIYFFIGAIFALLFVSVGCHQIDSDARESGIGFRIVIFPASAVLWPLLLYKWLTINKKEQT